MNTANYESFSQLNIQVGEIVEVQDFPRARNPSYKVKISFPEELWSSAQITNYSKEELIGKQVVCITNLPERNIAGFMSQALILGVPNSSGETILLRPDETVQKGVNVF